MVAVWIDAFLDPMNAQGLRQTHNLWKIFVYEKQKTGTV